MNNELQIINQNGQLLVDSREVAQMVGKKHTNLLRDIRRIVEREKEFENEFIKSKYVDLQNKKQPMYLISEKGKERLMNRYKYRASTPSLEKSFGEWLEKLFPNEKIIKQYKVMNFKIDFYMADLGICIEYDEKEHEYHEEQDEIRQREIQEWLKEDYLKNVEYDRVVLRKDASESFPFIRVKEGYEVEAIRELLLLIHEKTMSDVVTYMG